jgi:hypothetical protein
VIDALDACVAAEDVMARLYRPIPSAPHDDAAVLASMRNWFAQSKSPSPVTRDDGFRAVAADLARRGPRRRERTTLCDLAAIFASRESTLAAERGGREWAAAFSASVSRHAPESSEHGKTAPPLSYAIGGLPYLLNRSLIASIKRGSPCFPSSSASCRNCVWAAGATAVVSFFLPTRVAA